MPNKWDLPLVIRRGQTEIAIESAKAALHFLESEWPSERGYLHGLAKRRCEANLRGFASARSAQLALQAAFSEIGMFPKAT
jgi:hypothetical protein